MEDENAQPPSKKRVATNQITKDNPGLDDEEDSSQQETGTFKRASDDILASRRIVKVRRQNTSSAASSPSMNPFAAIRLVPPAPAPPSVAPAMVTIEIPASGEKISDAQLDQSTEKNKEPENQSVPKVGDAEKKADEVVVESAKDDALGISEESAGTVDTNDAAEKGDGGEKTEMPKLAENKEATDTVVGGDGTKLGDEKESKCEKADSDNNAEQENSVSPNVAPSLSSFQQLSSSQNAFTGLAGTGFSSSTFSFGLIPKDGSPSGSGSLFAFNTDSSSIPSFGFATSTNGTGSLFGTTGAAAGTSVGASGFPSMKEVPVETGEENERSVFSADAVLFEFPNGSWKERGKGEVKVNISTSGEKERARLVMRSRGNLRLILNASLYPDMMLANMDKRGVSFACINATTEGNDSLSTFALKFKDGSIMESFSSAVAAHKGETTKAPKTPQNSTDASDV